LAAQGTRTFPIRESQCGVPASAQAYSLNLAVVPNGPLGYLTAWPSGKPQPLGILAFAFRIQAFGNSNK
jgi:hypothetical protein